MVGGAITKEGEGFCAVAFVLQLDDSSVSISVVIARSKFATCYHWGKLGKEYRNLYYFLQLYVNLQLCQNMKLGIYRQFNKEMLE